MRWTAGHIWVTDVNINENRGEKSYFMYKYVVINHGNHTQFERGLDRIADLKLLNSNINNYI